MPPKRGPYKKYLQDDNAPIPKRSRSYYDLEQGNDENDGQQNANVEEEGELQAEDDQNVNMPRDTEQDIQNDQIEEEYDRVIENEGEQLVQELNLCVGEQSEQDMVEESENDTTREQSEEEEFNDDNNGSNNVESSESEYSNEQSAEEQNEDYSGGHIVETEEVVESDEDLRRRELLLNQERDREVENSGRTPMGPKHCQNNPRVFRAAAGAEMYEEAENPDVTVQEYNNSKDNDDQEDEIGLDVYIDNEDEATGDQAQHEIHQPDHNNVQHGDHAEELIGEGEQIEHAEAAGPKPHSELRKAIATEIFTSPITSQVMASPAEVLIMTLNMAEQNQLTFKAFVDSVKLLNSLFAAPIIPNTVYMLDKLLHSSAGIQRYFYCVNCLFSFGNRDSTVEPSLVCPECDCVNKITDLTKAAYLVVYPFPSQIELLLKNKEVRESLKSPKQLVKDRDPNVLTDIYDGKSYKHFANGLTEEANSIVISLIGNTDGTPLFKSSTYSIWPFFASINELPPAMRMKNLLLGGLWFGNKKPPMDLYLQPVVNHLIELADGFTIELGGAEVSMKVFMIGMCVDSGARGSVQGINTHSGYFSCNWCEIPGEYTNKVVFPFPEIPPEKRTHESVVQHARECLENNRLFYVYGVQYLSPLARLPKFDLVNGMVLDYAHNILFGLSRGMLEEWLTNTSRGYYIGSPSDIQLLDEKIMALRPPIEVRKPIRKVSDRAHWSMREFENWTLIYSIPVLTGILPLKYLQHWSYLVQGMFLLTRQKITGQDKETAHKLLLHYGRDAEYLYGKNIMTYNMHILSLHLAENVAQWGPLCVVNTYCYEAGNKDLKGILHAQHGVPHQIHRALSYRQATSILEINCGTQKTEAYKASIAAKVNKMTRYTPVPECALIGISKRFIPSVEEKYIIEQSGFVIDTSNCIEFKKLVARKCVYVIKDYVSNKKFDNGCALTVDSRIISMQKFILDQLSERVYIFFNEMIAEPFLKMPQGISIPPTDHCMRVITLLGRRLHLISVQNLKSVCSVSNMNEKMYVSEFPNVLNIF